MTGRREWFFFAIPAALALACLYQLTAPQPAYSVPAVSARPPPELGNLPPPYTAPPETLFAVIADRPLFQTERKKFIAPAVAEKTAPPPAPNLSLVGVIIDSDRRLALVKSGEGTLASSIGIGAVIAGWQVSAIEPDRIVLAAGGANDEIRLDANKAPPQNVSTAGRPTGESGQGSGQQQNTP